MADSCNPLHYWTAKVKKPGRCADSGFLSSTPQNTRSQPINAAVQPKSDSQHCSAKCVDVGLPSQEQPGWSLFFVRYLPDHMTWTCTHSHAHRDLIDFLLRGVLMDLRHHVRIPVAGKRSGGWARNAEAGKQSKNAPQSKQPNNSLIRLVEAPLEYEYFDG